MSTPPFPFDVGISVSEFLSMQMGQFYPRSQGDKVYYHGRMPSLHPTSDGSNSRLVLSPHTSDENIKDLKRGIGRLYDVTRLFRLIFPNPSTHPLVHHSEVCLMLLYEDWYTCFVQSFMHWIPLDSSQTSVLFAYGNIPPETEGVIDIQSHSFPAAAGAESAATQSTTTDTHPTNTSPPAPPKKAKKRSWFQPGFLQPEGPVLRNANPDVATVGLLLSSGDSKADIELTRVFEDLQRERVD